MVGRQTWRPGKYTYGVPVATGVWRRERNAEPFAALPFFYDSAAFVCPISWALEAKA